SVEKGLPIAGLAEGVATVALPLRDAGRLRSPAEMDELVLAAVEKALAAGHRVLLHVMDHSKLGARCPSAACLAAIAAHWGDAVQVVIDACQMRLSRARLAAHLAQGHMVLITGSKFFTGPPFSGGLLVPPSLGARLAKVDEVPAGLADYTGRGEWPVSWPGLRAGLAERANLGQLLRWSAALQEMRDYFAVPAEFRRYALGRFAEIVPGLIASEENLELLSDPRTDSVRDEEWASRSIFPFLVRHRSLAAQPCHIGQPVALALPQGGSVAALRISAGARVVSESWSAAGEAASLANLEREFEQVRVILAKLDLLVRHFDAIERAFAQNRAAA